LGNAKADPGSGSGHDGNLANSGICPGQPCCSHTYKYTDTYICVKAGRQIYPAV
jgi:hypothetical protein